MSEEKSAEEPGPELLEIVEKEQLQERASKEIKVMELISIEQIQGLQERASIGTASSATASRATASSATASNAKASNVSNMTWESVLAELTVEQQEALQKGIRMMIDGKSAEEVATAIGKQHLTMFVEYFTKFKDLNLKDLNLKKLD